MLAKLTRWWMTVMGVVETDEDHNPKTCPMCEAKREDYAWAKAHGGLKGELLYWRLRLGHWLLGAWWIPNPFHVLTIVAEWLAMLTFADDDLVDDDEQSEAIEIA